MIGQREIRQFDRWTQRLERHLQLLRGRIARWQGVRAGIRFGLGKDVRIIYPSWLTVGDDVTIEDHGYLHCLSERGVTIGKHTSIARNLWLHCGSAPTNHEHGYFEIGQHSFIGCNAVIGASGSVSIGNHVQIGPGLTISPENHSFDDLSRRIDEQGVQLGVVVINDNCWIGSNVTILAGVTIGEGTVLGAGTVVTTSIPSGVLAAGVPARVLRMRGQISAR